MNQRCNCKDKFSLKRDKENKQRLWEISTEMANYYQFKKPQQCIIFMYYNSFDCMCECVCMSEFFFMWMNSTDQLTSTMIAACCSPSAIVPNGKTLYIKSHINDLRFVARWRPFIASMNCIFQLCSPFMWELI